MGCSSNLRWFSRGGNKVQDKYNVIIQCTIFLFKHCFGELDSGHKFLVIVDFDTLLKKPEAMNKKKGLKFSMATSQIGKKMLLLTCSQANNNIAHLGLLEAKAPQVSLLRVHCK